MSTMPALSTVPEVRAALANRIPAYLLSAGIDDARTTYAEPDGDEPVKFVAVCGLKSPTIDDSHRNPRADAKRDEEYVLDIVFGAFAPGRHDNEAAQEVYEACWAMARAVAKGVRATTDDNTLGGLCTWARFDSFGDAEWWPAEGRRAFITGGLRVSAVHI